jgi:hypothetical protein
VKPLALALALTSSAALAQVVAVSPDLRDLMNARNVAMGGAYEALGYGVEAVGGNPAAMSLYKRYAIEATGSWDIPQGYGNGSIGLLDATNPLVAGLSYHFATFGGAERRWAHVTTLALAYALADLIHLGIATRHHAIIGASTTNSVTLNAGLIIHPATWLTLGFSGHNLIANYNVDLTRYFVASISSQLFGQLSPAFDLRFDFNQPVVRFAFHGGIEWLIAQTVPVRVGYQYDGIAGHQYISFGLGYANQGSGVDVAYRHELLGQGGRMVSLTLKLQM